jgi:hypothetical protein
MIQEPSYHDGAKEKSNAALSDENVAVTTTMRITRRNAVTRIASVRCTKVWERGLSCRLIPSGVSRIARMMMMIKLQHLSFRPHCDVLPPVTTHLLVSYPLKLADVVGTGPARCRID